MSQPILPGSIVGIVGGGEVGRMLAIAARRMGYRVHTLSPDADTPAGQVADREYRAAYDDLETVRAFARGVDVVTLECENIPTPVVEVAAEFAPVRPGGTVLYLTQHRMREKTFLHRAGFPVPPFQAVRTVAELHTALRGMEYPVVLKTAGFDGGDRGPIEISDPAGAEPAFAALGGQEAILEARVDFERELSVVAARAEDGTFAHYGAIDNTHSDYRLDVSVAPATVPRGTAQEAVRLARGVLEALEVVGVLCVELFLTRDGRLLIHKLTPRPHNSGHLTFDACVTSQFEQHLRAICHLPLGATELLRPAAMANLPGDLWQDQDPDWAAACAFPEVKVHLYGKQEPHPGRQMGHLTALAPTPREAEQRVRAARDALRG